MTKCLSALSNPTILGAGVERLLSSIMDIDLVSIPIQDQFELIERIKQIQADVVLVEGNGFWDDDFLASLITVRPGLLVIEIDAEDNLLKTYQHHHLYIRHTSELFGLIQSQKPTDLGKEENTKII